MSIEKTVLSNLLYKEEYCRKVLPFLKVDYFQEQSEKAVFSEINEYFTKYNRLPSKKELALEFETRKLNSHHFNEIIETIDGLSKNLIENDEWLLEHTEKFCKDKALYNAILKSIEIAEGDHKDISTGSIPKMLEDALGVCFDPRVGHDYLDDAEERWDFYHHLEKRVPFDIELLNKITKGGLPQKSLTAVMVETGGGKSMLMCHCAAAQLTMGYNVLYITMEMDEERISERIDANLLNVDIGSLAQLSKSDYMSKMEKVRQKVKGKLIVKEYPENSASVANFRFLLNELKVKKSFVPDIIYVDYVGIVASSRLKKGNHNSYEYGKAVYEELRALAKEQGLPIFTGVQTNRLGVGTTDLDMTMVSETFGGPMTCDLLFAITHPADMQEMGQALFIQLKNRYNDVNNPKRFVVGVDKAKMRFYDVDSSAQTDILDGPVMDSSPVFREMTDKRGKFEGFV